MESLFQFSAHRLDGRPQPLADYQGQVVLVVNTASACGYTPQYAGLEKLYEEYRSRGFTVLGFPCNDFGEQEPGTAEQIAVFCSRHYGVQFPLFEKIHIRGPAQSPIYRFLAAQHGEPRWNFHKYLVGKDGRVRCAFPSSVAPESPELRAAIEAALQE